MSKASKLEIAVRDWEQSTLAYLPYLDDSDEAEVWLVERFADMKAAQRNCATLRQQFLLRILLLTFLWACLMLAPNPTHTVGHIVTIAYGALIGYLGSKGFEMSSQITELSNDAIRVRDEIRVYIAALERRQIAELQ